MDIKIRVKHSDRKQEIESFGNNMYLAYVMSSDERGVIQELTQLISKKLGVPPNRIELKSQNGQNIVLQLS